MNLAPLEHPRPIPVKPHTRSRPYVQEFNTTTRELMSCRDNRRRIHRGGHGRGEAVTRRSFSKKDRARIFASANGVCHLCLGAITVGEAWEVEHVIAWELTRDDSDENLRPAHVKCHREKTHKQDRPAIQKAKDREAKHTGAARPTGKLKGRGFPTPDKPERITKQPLPPRAMFRLWPASSNREGD